MVLSLWRVDPFPGLGIGSASWVAESGAVSLVGRYFMDLCGDLGGVSQMLLKEKGKYKKEAIKDLIVEATKKKRFTKVNQIVDYFSKEYELPEDLTISLIEDLEAEERLLLSRKREEEAVERAPPIEGVIDYFRSPFAYDYWVVVGLAIAAAASTGIPADAVPLVGIRWVLGTFFVLFLPGYSLTAILFPTGDEIDNIERVAISFGLSITVSPLVALGLNFTPWGIRLAPLLASLVPFTLICATLAAVMRARRLMHPSEE